MLHFEFRLSVRRLEIHHCRISEVHHLFSGLVLRQGNLSRNLARSYKPVDIRGIHIDVVVQILILREESLRIGQETAAHQCEFHIVAVPFPCKTFSPLHGRSRHIKANVIAFGKCANSCRHAQRCPVNGTGHILFVIACTCQYNQRQYRYFKNSVHNFNIYINT